MVVVQVRVALLFVVLLVVPASGCFGGDGEALETLVPYPHMGDVATYDVSGGLFEFSRWENGIAFPSGRGQVRLSLSESPPVIDGARAIHDVFRVTSERNSGGGFVKQAERFVTARHEAVVQASYPLSQDQSIVAFDERGFPWLFGASVLFGADPARDASTPFTLWDNLGRSNPINLSWDVQPGTERVDGMRTTRFDLAGTPSLTASLWLAPGSPWPVKARFVVNDAGLAPHVRTESTPFTMEARLVGVTEGTSSVQARDRSAGYSEDNLVARLDWDGEKPPDGTTSALPYRLDAAVSDAKTLDLPLSQWLAAANDPRVYRATFQEEAGPAPGTNVPSWLVQFVDASNTYYEVEIERVDVAAVNVGVPRVTRSGLAEPPADKNHGWFPANALREDLVPLDEAIRIVRDVFGAEGIQVFLRSFIDPPGYSYFIDGGFDGVGRYTVIYNPETGFIEEATGPVKPRLGRNA